MNTRNFLFYLCFCLRWRFPPSTLRFYSIEQWSCSAPGSLWEMPDSNPGLLPQKSGALPMSHHIYATIVHVPSLKGQCHEIFVIFLFNESKPPGGWAPDKQAKLIKWFCWKFPFSQRYSQNQWLCAGYCNNSWSRKFNCSQIQNGPKLRGVGLSKISISRGFRISAQC